jgi:4-diphosphocytidyl-2C-methyl-D-erythritol kinase
LETAQAPQAWFVIAIPPLAAATPEVFAALQAPVYQASEAQDAMKPREFPDRPAGNDLTEAALLCIPGLADVSKRLATIAAFQLSGSGSAWFTVVPDGAVAGGRELARKQAESLAERVQSEGYRASVHRPWPSPPEVVQ